MTLTIHLDPELEGRLREEATKHDLDASEYVVHLLEQSLPTRATAERRVSRGSPNTACRPGSSRPCLR